MITQCRRGHLSGIEKEKIAVWKVVSRCSVKELSFEALGITTTFYAPIRIHGEIGSQVLCGVPG